MPTFSLATQEASDRLESLRTPRWGPLAYPRCRQLNFRPVDGNNFSTAEAPRGGFDGRFENTWAAYRQADLKTKLGQLSDEQALALLASDGMLVKRPFIIDDDGNGLVGYNEAALTELLA